MIRGFKKEGLQRKIFLLMLVVGVFPGLVGVSAVYFMGNRLVMRSVGPGLIGTAEKAASEVDIIFQYEFSQANNFARLSNIRDFTKKAAAKYETRDADKYLAAMDARWSSGDRKLIKEVLENELAEFLNSINSEPDWNCILFVTDIKGRIIASTDHLLKYIYADEIWWQEAMKGNNYVGGPQICKKNGVNALIFALPILSSEDNKAIGVLYLERRADKILSPLTNFRFGKTGHLEIVTDKGYFVMEALGSELSQVPQWLTEAISLKNKGWAAGIDEHGKDSIKGFAPTKFNGWHVVLSQELNEIYAPLKALMWGAAGPGFLTVVILATIWFGISRRMILKPISQLGEGAHKIGHGHLDHRLEIKTGDELEELANEFNIMAENLNLSQEKLKRWNEDLQKEVARRTSELEEANEELKESKEELQDSLQQVMALNEQIHTNREELSKRNDELAGANLKLREMDRLKSEFLANMSHELRTPLTAIIGFSELLIDKVMGELNEEQTGCVDNILTSGQHLLKLINDILDLSKIEAGKMELHPESFDPRTIIDFVRKTVTPLAEKKGQTLNVEVAEEVADIFADPGKIKQLLLNLVGNAIKFTPDGGSITIGGEFKENCFAISVKDTGIGIKPEDQEKIFQEFQQAEGSTSREYGGTGLGLTLTRKLTEMHGGKIELESEVGKGSKFTAYIPLKPENVHPVIDIAAKKHPSKDLQYLGPTMRMDPQPLVLVVEDDPKLSRLLTVYLEQAGYIVETALDGDEALKKAIELQPFAITLDIMLPRKDGWEVLQELKSQAETRNIPVIVVSMVENQELAFSLGAVDYLVKPVNRESLLGSLGKYSYRTRTIKGSANILVVDDDPKIVDFLTTILRKEGFHATSAAGGEEGLTKAMEECPDMILLDLMMPKVSGFDVIRELKKHPSTKDIPVFVLTARDLSSDERERLLADVNKVIQKGGVSKEDLVEEIKRMEILYPERAGLIDNVTGLLNHRYFMNRISHEVSRCCRYGRALSVALIDVDSFAYYNEINGYLMGDVVLKEIARLLLKNLRKVDVAMRYSGGKFAIIFPETEREAIMSVAEKIRLLIEEFPFQKRENQPSGKITVSVSVAGCQSGFDSVAELIERLEKTVLDAGKAGGNRVEEVKKTSQEKPCE